MRRTPCFPECIRPFQIIALAVIWQLVSRIARPDLSPTGGISGSWSPAPVNSVNAGSLWFTRALPVSRLCSKTLTRLL